MMRVRRISAADTRPLRQRVLRPNERAEDLVWPHDDAPDTFHGGVFVDGALVAIATIHRQEAPAACFPERAPFPDHANDARAWRLRGMATAHDGRGRGYGAALVASCIDHARAHGAGGAIVWCNARVSAAPFYEKLGFAKHGDAFELPAIGPHYVMSKRVD